MCEDGGQDIAIHIVSVRKGIKDSVDLPVKWENIYFVVLFHFLGLSVTELRRHHFGPAGSHENARRSCHILCCTQVRIACI